jgi:hypothetical protein
VVRERDRALRLGPRASLPDFLLLVAVDAMDRLALKQTEVSAKRWTA